MAERMLITKVIRTDQTTAELYAKGHRYRDLILWDLAELAEVGIDYDALQVGVETPARFWAYYELSSKLNKSGNPYRDIVALEPIDRPATAMATDTTAILSELRRIAGILEAMAQAQGLSIPDLPEVATDAGGDGDGDQEPGDGSPTPGSNGRPLPATRIRDVIRIKAGWKGPLRLDSEPITEKQIPALAGLLGKAIRQKGMTQALMDKARHQVLAYLLGVDSTKALTKREAMAMIDWMAAGNGNAAELNEHARAEVAAVLTEIAREQGQLEMPL
jgi:hypothetical protein